MANLSLKKNNRFSLGIDSELNDKMTYLSKMTHKSKADLLREWIEPNFQIAASFESCNFWLMQSGSTITIQWFGKSRMCNGKNMLDDDDANNLLQKTIKKELLEIA